MKIGSSVLALVGVFCVSAPAWAQSSAAQASRRVLLDQAQAARASNDHARALDAAQRAGRIEMTPSVRLFIAEEQEALGQTAQAMGSADSCVREAQAANVPTRDVILARCRELLGTLRTRVGYIVVRVPAARPAGLEVVLAGEPLPDVLYNIPAVATPGNVVIEAHAPGRRPFRQQVTLAVGQTRELEISLPDAPDSGSTSSGGVSLGGPSAGPRDQGSGRGARLSPGGVVVLGVGVVGVAMAPVFLALRDGAASGCAVGQEIVCPDEASAARARAAPDYNTGITVSLIAGGALVAGGVTWILVDMLGGQRASARSRAALTVLPTPGGAMLSVGGAL